MTIGFHSGWLLPMLAASLGISTTFWCIVGLCRFVLESLSGPPRRQPSLSVADVAVVIPAHNEEVALPKCLAALAAIVPPSQIHVASDGSRDRTVAIAREAGCNVLDIQPNGGKAKALASAIEKFELCERYKAVLIQDADSEIDPHYLDHALPLFDDPRNAVVAGHVLSRWRNQFWPSLDMLYAAYRTRLYRLLQMVFQYGQTWRWTLKRDGRVADTGRSITRGPSGSFEVHRRTANPAGRDTFTFRAVHRATGEVCVARVTR